MINKSSHSVSPGIQLNKYVEKARQAFERQRKDEVTGKAKSYY